MVNKVLRLPAVKARTGLSRSTLYLRISNHAFPRPISLGGRSVGWLEHEVESWIEAQKNLTRRQSEVRAEAKK
ncbi:helix-turn-helix transcriptional regulator [Congregibacter litoralis]|uniref:Transcriptional regulator, AlpA family n=1 Tax=Congregibacter litoralis KT71 TaxID=314285 RepID=V7HUX5_9GAMM|nr:AlpA family transcriptional regulator [Congregibacter litoralis]ESZ89342.1 transcriptional regulator, AlpA family [Congregibacter litoralis KT71]